MPNLKETLSSLVDKNELEKYCSYIQIGFLVVLFKHTLKVAKKKKIYTKNVIMLYYRNKPVKVDKGSVRKIFKDIRAVNPNIKVKEGVAFASISVKKPLYADEFNAAWAVYPKRSGGNAKMPAAKAWNVRIKEGVDPGLLIKATKGYAAYCMRERKVNTEYVLMASTFYGPDRRWEDFLDIKKDIRTVNDDVRRANVEAIKKRIKRM